MLILCLDLQFISPLFDVKSVHKLPHSYWKRSSIRETSEANSLNRNGHSLFYDDALTYHYAVSYFFVLCFLLLAFSTCIWLTCKDKHCYMLIIKLSPHMVKGRLKTCARMSLFAMDHSNLVDVATFKIHVHTPNT